MSFMYFLAVLIGPLVKILYSFIGNYAATMIVATLILKLLLFPLSIHQQKSTAKMSVFQPLITEIQQKYKNNQEKMQEEIKEPAEMEKAAEKMAEAQEARLPEGQA